MYYVLMTDFNNGIKLVGKHEIKGDAIKHEEHMRSVHPDNQVWTCVNSGALE